MAILLFGPDNAPPVVQEPSATENPVGRLVRYREPKVIPDLAFAAADGRLHHLSEWRGKIVLLNLWATWCAPCKTEMPSLDRLKARLGGEEFAVLALSTDRGGTKETAAFFAASAIKHLDVYNDPTGQAMTQLRATGLPLTVILDKDGREIARLLGPSDWDRAETIEGLLAEAIVSPG